MAQFSRPDNDDAIGVWSDDGGGTTNIFQSIDEIIASDTDFVRSDTTPTAAEDYDAGMSSVTDPVSDSGHILRWRYAKSASGGRTIAINLELRDGSTVITTRSFTDISEVFTQDTYTLSAAEADNISDYSNLNVRIDAVRSGGGAARRGQVSWVELEVPDAAAAVRRSPHIPRNLRY